MAQRRGEGTLIRLDGVSVDLGGRSILMKVDLALAPGEVVTVIGPNGAGKSTLAHVVLGLIPPTGGTVQRRPGLTVGYLPQRIHVDPVLPITVDRLMTLTIRVDAQRRRDALEEVGCTHLAGRAFQSLSGGEVQRVLLARALLRDPDLLVLDEPAQAVDILGQGEVYGLIGEIRRRRGCGVLMISHDLHVVMQESDRVVCLHHHVCCVGTPAQVGDDPAYRALFGGRGVDHLAVYHHHHHEVHDLSGYPGGHAAAHHHSHEEHDRGPADA